MKYITFTKEMARAYREGRKTMTRRVMKPQPSSHLLPGELIPRVCPYGQPGDRLVFGTTWAVRAEYDHLKPTDLHRYEGSGLHDCAPIEIWSYFDGDEKPEGFGKLRPARSLPGFLCDRMPHETLKIVRAERVQEITHEEALLEGIRGVTKDGQVLKYCVYDHSDYSSTAWQKMPRNAVSAFVSLWDSINETRGYGWDANPYTWVLGWSKSCNEQK